MNSIKQTEKLLKLMIKKKILSEHDCGRNYESNDEQNAELRVLNRKIVKILDLLRSQITIEELAECSHK